MQKLGLGWIFQQPGAPAFRPWQRRMIFRPARDVLQLHDYEGAEFAKRLALGFLRPDIGNNLL